MKAFLSMSLLCAGLMLCACRQAVTLYVSPDGNDSHSGTQAEPLRSLEGARAAVRTVLKQSPGRAVTVCFADGLYQMEQAVSFTFEDAGSEGAPVIYKAAEGAVPVFTGSRRISGWSKAADEEVTARLKPEVRDKVVVADLAAAGINDYGDPATAGHRPDLICNDSLQTLARWPNRGFVYIAQTKGTTPTPDNYAHHIGCQEGIFTYTDPYQDRWATEEDVRLGGYWFWDWKDDFGSVERWDAAHRTVYLRQPWNKHGYRKGAHYFGFNMLCELDQPGEWYLSRATGKLFWYPPAGVEPSTAEVRLSCFDAPFMVELDSCSFVTFEGLTFRESRGSAVRIRSGESNLISECRIERFGRDGISIEGGKHHGIDGCLLSTLGHGGIKLFGGDRKTLTPSEHFVTNTVVDHFSIFQRTYEPAVITDGCGMSIAGNRFSRSSSSAMRLAGNDITVEYNEVSRVVEESDDQGGIDMYYGPSYQGVVIRYNHWKDIQGGTRHGAAGIRFDDMICGMVVYGNIFERCGAVEFGGVQINGGKDNLIENNVFYKCRAAVSFSSGWTAERWATEFDKPEVMKKIYQDVDIRSELYRKRYPLLDSIRENFNRNIIRRNLIVSCIAPFSFLNERQIIADNVELEADGKPISWFTSPAVLKRYGLEPIPSEKIGPQRGRWLR